MSEFHTEKSEESRKRDFRDLFPDYEGPENQNYREALLAANAYDSYNDSDLTDPITEALERNDRKEALALVNRELEEFHEEKGFDEYPDPPKIKDKLKFESNPFLYSAKISLIEEIVPEKATKHERGMMAFFSSTTGYYMGNGVENMARESAAVEYLDEVVQGVHYAQEVSQSHPSLVGVAAAGVFALAMDKFYNGLRQVDEKNRLWDYKGEDLDLD